MKKRILSIMLVVMLVLSMTACSDKTVSNDSANTESNNAKTDTKTEEGEKVSSTQKGNIVERSKGVTYRRYLPSTPATLDLIDTTTADSNDITNFTTIGFYGLKASDDGTEYEFICEMASEFPVDVTSKYAGDATYGVPADAKENYAYSIKLNPNAKWEDGTPITADDYIYSYTQVINPQMKNIRASEIYSGYLTIANAEAYYKQGIAYEDVAGNEKAAGYTEEQYFLTMTEPVYFFGGPAKQYYDNPSYKDSFKSADGRNLYDLYSKERYVPLTPQAKNDLIELAAAFGDSGPEAWKEFCVIQTENPAVDAATVGIKKVGDYEIEFILGAPTDEFFIKYTLTTNWLVNPTLYEANKKDTGGIIKTSYGNDKDKYMSFGPYKITEYIKDKLVVLKMNENWYGWTDGNHEYYSNFETLRYDIIPEVETAFQMFLKGQIDSVPVVSGKEEYAVSEYLSSMPNRYTYNMNFHVNRENLRGFETPGINKTMLSYKDFRQAISLGINRVNFCKALSPLSKPISGMLNETYITDPYTGMSYRDSEYGKKVLTDIYGGTDVDAGYDVAKARELAMKAYEEAKANGDYKDGDVITLSYPRAVDNERGKLLFATIENSVLEVLKGTPLEGKFKVEILLTDEWSAKMRTGEAQVSLSGGGGGAMDPYGLMEFNIRPGNTYGIEYKDVMATIKVDGKDITMDCVSWVYELTDGKYRTADSELRTMILAGIETAVLKEFASIPIESSSLDNLLSMRTSRQLDKYVPLVNLGETYFSMTDAEWDAYVKEQGGELDYK